MVLWDDIPTNSRYVLAGKQFVWLGRERGGYVPLAKVTKADVERLVAQFGPPPLPKEKK